MLFVWAGVFLIAFFISDNNFRHLLSNPAAYVGLLIPTLLLFLLEFEQTKEIRLTKDAIEYRYFFPIRMKRIALSEISHFCYHKNRLTRYDSPRKLHVFFKNQQNKKGVWISLNLPRHTNYELLSHIARQGFNVLIFEDLQYIQETEHYKE